MSSNAIRKFVLLDRDGTIVVDKCYQSDPEETELLPFAKEGLDLLRKHDFGLVMVTNQSGIGRGYLTRADLAAVNRSVIQELGGGDDYFAGVYYCPHLPDEGCRCRKPRPGLAELAAYDLGFGAAECYVVGDREADILLGDAIGASTVLVRTGHGREVEEVDEVTPDYVADNLFDAAQWIIRREKWVDSVTKTRHKNAT